VFVYENEKEKVSFGPYFEKIYISFCIMTNQRDFWLIANLQQNLRLAYQLRNFGLPSYSQYERKVLPYAPTAVG
jgi:hypothetical protein